MRGSRLFYFIWKKGHLILVSRETELDPTLAYYELEPLGRTSLGPQPDVVLRLGHRYIEASTTPNISGRLRCNLSSGSMSGKSMRSLNRTSKPTSFVCSARTTFHWVFPRNCAGRQKRAKQGAAFSATGLAGRKRSFAAAANHSLRKAWNRWLARSVC